MIDDTIHTFLTKNKKITYILLNKKQMKTLNLHTNNQLPTQRCEWTGISMFSAIANPAVLNLGKVDYISTNKLEDTDVG